MRASIIACGDASPVFEPAKHVLDLMALFIEGFAITSGKVSSPARWDAGRYPPGVQRSSELITVVPFICDQG